MKFHVLTLFPEMILQGLNPSIIGRAAEKNLITLDAVNIRDYTLDKHGKVDDYPYGGGAGMLIQAQPVFDAYKAVCGDKKVRTVYVTPQGTPFTQGKAKELAKEEELVFLCGHYEGIDERVLEEVVTDYVSIGDYVLTGGELPAMVMIDAIARLVPGVLGNDTSAEEESFYNDLLEYPQYSRPEIWHDKAVPDVLLSGNHKKVNAWRLEQSKARTAERRPDLYEKYQAKQRLIKQLSKDKRNNIHIIESLDSGKGEILYAKGEGVLVCDRENETAYCLAKDVQTAEKLAQILPTEVNALVVSAEFVKEVFEARGFKASPACEQYLYTQKVTLPVKYKDIRPLTMEHLDYTAEHYVSGMNGHTENAFESSEDSWGREYIAARIRAGAMYGAFDGDKQIGFIGVHSEGSNGMLYVDENYRGRGLAVSLEAYAINRQLEKGRTPYGHVYVGNAPSAKLQEKLGLYKASGLLWWMEKI